MPTLSLLLTLKLSAILPHLGGLLVYVALPSPKAVEMSSYLTVLQQENVILRACPFVVAMGAVSRKIKKSCSERLYGRSRKSCRTQQKMLQREPLLHKVYALRVVILKINASCVISGCCGHVVVKLQIINCYSFY